MANSSHYRNTVRNTIYRLSWEWASKKHKLWGRKLIANKYFLINLGSFKVHCSKVKYLKFRNRKWVFHGIVKKKSRYYKSKSKTIYLVDVNDVSQLLSSKFYILPEKYLNIHGYRLDYIKLIGRNREVNPKAGGIDRSFKECLLKR